LRCAEAVVEKRKSLYTFDEQNECAETAQALRAFVLVLEGDGPIATTTKGRRDRSISSSPSSNFVAGGRHSAYRDAASAALLSFL
jgi:hypothetical protein